MTECRVSRPNQTIKVSTMKVSPILSFLNLNFFPKNMLSRHIACLGFLFPGFTLLENDQKQSLLRDFMVLCWPFKKGGGVLNCHFPPNKLQTVLSQSFDSDKNPNGFGKATFLNAADHALKTGGEHHALCRPSKIGLPVKCFEGVWQ